MEIPGYARRAFHQRRVVCYELSVHYQVSIHMREWPVHDGARDSLAREHRMLVRGNEPIHKVVAERNAIRLKKGNLARRHPRKLSSDIHLIESEGGTRPQTKAAIWVSFLTA